MGKEKWCKIIETEEYDILVQLDTNDDGDYCIKISFPCEFGMASTDLGIRDNLDPQEVFNNFRDEQAIGIAASTISQYLTINEEEE